MILNVYSVRDLTTGFNQPWCDKNDDAAIRGFSYSINNNDIMGFKPTDFELFQIGTFDTDTGKMSEILPELICRGGDVIANQ